MRCPRVSLVAACDLQECPSLRAHVQLNVGWSLLESAMKYKLSVFLLLIQGRRFFLRTVMAMLTLSAD